MELRLGHDEVGDREGEVLGGCILTAYARKFEGVGLALRLSLRPGWIYTLGTATNGQIREVLTRRVQRKELSTGGLVS